MNFIYYYLKDRQVFYVNEIFETSRHCYRGCPQGSVIAPIIWNVYINNVLKLNDGELYVQAFADDLALIIGGRTARVLEANTNLALASIARSLDSLKLDLSVQKCRRRLGLVVTSMSKSVRLWCTEVLHHRSSPSVILQS
ncbi:hypothetical protein AVEN_213506-1 [Araneus ventricosus]|uniref:Reverse transcriptase domain-containing protein n=1 Tax=Araneus ventricosus TaxID=182803 RepID=A0A4Y2W7U4_ARAVE|nr:hypothetical protein AVEN_213506-1 [Araneus ventricosus]